MVRTLKETVFFEKLKVNESEIFKQISVTTNGTHQQDFLKVAVLNC